MSIKAVGGWLFDELIYFSNGVWGVAPSRVRAAAPQLAPFLGKGVWG